MISLGVVSSSELDALGAGKALKEAHRRAIEGTYFRLSVTDPIIVIDGVMNPNLNAGVVAPTVFCLPKGDQIVPAITLASIIGKVYHDREMFRYSKEFPGYGFESNKGYRSPVHETALQTMGLTAIHRRTYAPMKDMIRDSVPPRPLWDIDE